jgi:hypothetical protein
MSIKFMVAALLKKYGVYMNEATNRDTIHKLLQKLKPVDTGVELIRMGGNNDGGYLVPNDMEGIDYCFSPGVDVIANFENDCLKKGIKSFLADYSVERPPINLEGSQFIKKFVGAYNSDITITMEDWMKQSLPQNHNNDLILQMDIEGAEYETLLSTPVSVLKKFRIIVLEIHNFQKLDNREYFKLINATIEKVTEHFVPVHLHINNCDTAVNVNGIDIPPIFEVTFLRKDRIKKIGQSVSLPHPLDQPNFADRKDIPIPSYWS